MPPIRDLIAIPERVRQGGFVPKLSEGMTIRGFESHSFRQKAPIYWGWRTFRGPRAAR